jgi:hypothetical protein
MNHRGISCCGLRFGSSSRAFLRLCIGWQADLPGQRSLRSRHQPPHDGVRSTGTGMSRTRSLISDNHSRNGAHAIAVTSPWQELPSADEQSQPVRAGQRALWQTAQEKGRRSFFGIAICPAGGSLMPRLCRAIPKRRLIGGWRNTTRGRRCAAGPVRPLAR